MNRTTVATATVLFFALGTMAVLPAAGQGRVPLAWSHSPEEMGLEGWEEVGEGFWKRTLGDGTVETEALGRAGLVQVLDQLNAEMVNLVEDYLLDPTAEMAKVLDTHLALIEGVEESILAAEEGPQLSLRVDPSCTTSYSASAVGLSGCGNYAQASSSYSGTSAAACYGLCDLYSYAYVRRTVCNNTNYTASHSCSKPGVINDSCSSSVSLTHNPVKSCYAYGYASINCPSISWFRSTSKTSYSCGLGTCQGCSGCSATASCANAGGGSVSCTGTSQDCYAIDDCYAYCDGIYTWCPNPPLPCPV